MSVAVTNHNDGVEAESPSTFHNLRNTIDVDQLFLEFQFACFEF
jgi:hypothetical protein